MPVSSPHWISHVLAPVKPDYENALQTVAHHLINVMQQSVDQLGLKSHLQLQGVLADMINKYARKADVDTLEA